VSAATSDVVMPAASPAAAVGPVPGSARTTLWIGLAGAAVLVAVTAPFMTRYGWDRDELYFLSAAHHLALGYVDFPPLTAVIGWIVDQLAPSSLLALRVVSLAAGAGTVILVAFIVRELGGGHRAQWIAVLAWALTPYILGSASIFRPTWLDALAWVGFLYVSVRLLVRQDLRLWLVLGLIAGVGLEAKYTIAVLTAVFAGALILTNERRQLKTIWPWMGLAIALSLLLPNLVWQVQHGWPSVHFFATQNAQTASDTSRPAYLAEQLLFVGSTAVLAAAGVVWMWRRGLRTLALIPVLVTVVFLLERGRSYYPLPADALAVAAGAVAVERWLKRGRRVLLGAAGAADRRHRPRGTDRGALLHHTAAGSLEHLEGRLLQGRDRLARDDCRGRASLGARRTPRPYRRCDPCSQLRGGLRAPVLRPGTSADSQRTPQLALLAPRATPTALRAHRRLLGGRSPGSLRLLEAAEPHREPLAPW
jgi:hypothetical protein